VRRAQIASQVSYHQRRGHEVAPLAQWTLESREEGGDPARPTGQRAREPPAERARVPPGRGLRAARVLGEHDVELGGAPIGHPTSVACAVWP
jgi:hypothetical protein